MSPSRDNTGAWPRRSGFAATMFGIAALGGFGWLWLVTATPIDPPEWARIAGIWLLPIGVIGASVTGIASMRTESKVWAISGLILAGLAVVGAALLIVLWPA